MRDCARPAFALERLREIDPEHLVYESVKPGPKGSVSLMLTPMQLLDRLAALIPPPRRHRHRYYGVLAPNSPLRAAVTALARPAGGVLAPATIDPTPHTGPTPPAETTTEEPLHRQAARYAWALLLARIYDQRKSPWDEVLPLLCPKCGGVLGYRLRLCLRHKMRIIPQGFPLVIAFITEAVVIRKILGHLGEQTSPPALKPARGPPLWEMQQDGQAEIDPHAQASPAYAFDQRIAW